MLSKDGGEMDMSEEVLVVVRIKEFYSMKGECQQLLRSLGKRPFVLSLMNVVCAILRLPKVGNNYPNVCAPLCYRSKGYLVSHCFHPQWVVYESWDQDCQSEFLELQGQLPGCKRYEDFVGALYKEEEEEGLVQGCVFGHSGLCCLRPMLETLVDRPVQSVRVHYNGNKRKVNFFKWQAAKQKWTLKATL